jgi:hypothetical protein
MLFQPRGRALDSDQSDPAAVCGVLKHHRGCGASAPAARNHLPIVKSRNLARLRAPVSSESLEIATANSKGGVLAKART